MDFSSVLAKEINKKRKANARQNTAKRVGLGLNHEIRHGEQTKNDAQENLLLRSKSVQCAHLNTHPDHKRYTSEELELVNSITDDQLREKLAGFSEPALGQDKLTNVKKLQILTRNQNRLIKYKDQIELESKLYGNPQNKRIQLDHLTNVQQNENELYVQLRVCIKDLVKEWEDVESEDPDQKQILYETKADLIKLLYKLRAHKLPENMLTSLSTIVYYIQNQDFRRANESYMKLSIGNVAWPIGVRDVGIHARSADLKITKANANIMIDDKTRRWITAIKRLITFSERKMDTQNG